MAAPERFGKYQLLSRIASGGMAEVWLARSSSIGGFEKLLAIKRMHPQMSRNQAFVSMFIDEAKLTVRLSHPSIVQVFDFGQVDGEYFIAMEYVEGVDLAQLASQARARQLRLPVALSVLVAKQVLDGLAYAHARTPTRGPIVHRDVSPQNVLVSLHGHVKVSDFGIAKAASEIEGGQGEIFGKVAYASPEQCRGEAVDEATDIWAAGVVLHELLTGVRLFARDKDFLTIGAVTRGPIAPPSGQNPGVPPELDDVVLSMLERDRSRRVRSAREASVALARILGGNYPSITEYDLAELISELWNGRPPRIEGDATREEGPVLTRPSRPPPSPRVHEATVPGAPEAEDTWAGEATAPSTEVAGASEPTASAGPLPALEGRAGEQARVIERRFLAEPDLWRLAELGALYEEVGLPRWGRAARKLAAARFAQRGLLLQAACLYRPILAASPGDPRLAAEARALVGLPGQGATAVLEALFATPERAEAEALAGLFGAGPERVEVWSESPILGSLDADQLASFLEAVDLRTFDPGDVVLAEGAPGDSFFLLGRGRVVVSTTNFEGRKTYVGSLSDGDCFGEQAFFTGAPRAATVEAVEEVTVLEVSRQVLARLLALFPAVDGTLRRFYRDRVAESLLAKSPLFGHLGTRERKSLAERFTFETRATGDLILRRGEVSDAFYAVRSGSVEVFAQDGEGEAVFAVLGPGEIFGEAAALEGTRRTASVRARESCELLRLEASELNAVLARHTGVRQRMEETIQGRAEARERRLPGSGLARPIEDDA